MKSDFYELKRKIFLKVLLIAIAAPILGLIIQNMFIDGILQNKFADIFMEICQNSFELSFEESMNLYNRLFRFNKAWWLASGLYLLLLVVFYYALSQMTKYFNEVSTGVNQLVKESDKEIKLSHEMSFMEIKLNKIKNILQKKERDAKEAEQRKNDLVVYLAHDIKTPLTSVIGYLNLLDEARDMPNEQKENYISIALEKSYRLEQLIDEFFEITRFNLQTIVLNKEKINLTFMLQQMADEFYPMLSPQNKKVNVKAADNLSLWGDADKLARVFNNILKNAIAYSFDNSVIEISAYKKDENVIIEFANKGKPIPPQRLNTIFEKFYRLDVSRSTEKGGAGLGLAIAKEIISAHGGKIYAKSDDNITSFTIELPDIRNS